MRGSVLLAGLLIFWWFVLLNPMLAALEQSAVACGALVFGSGSPRLVTPNPAGDWAIEIPLEVTVPASPQQPNPVHLRTIAFDLARSDAGAFTFGLPVYWAVILAVPRIRRSVRPLVLGTLVMALVEVVLLLIFAEILGHRTAARWSHSEDAVAKWFLRFGEYLVVGVIPYVIPFVVAIGMHPELRRQFLGWAGGTPVPAEGVPVPARAAGSGSRKAKKASAGG